MKKRIIELGILLAVLAGMVVFSILRLSKNPSPSAVATHGSIPLNERRGEETRHSSELQHDDSSGANPRLPSKRSTGALKGKVVSLSGAAVKGALVTVWPSAGAANAKSFEAESTDKNGGFLVKDLVPGRYKLHISHWDFAKKILEADIREGATTDVNITLVTWGALKLSFDPDIRIATFIAVIISSDAYERIGQFSPDEVIPHLSAGAKQIIVIPLRTDHAPVQAFCTVEDEGLTEVRVRPPQALGIQGLIVDTDNLPISGIDVEVGSEIPSVQGVNLLMGGSVSWAPSTGDQWEIWGVPPRIIYTTRTDSEGKFYLPPALCQGDVIAKFLKNGVEVGSATLVTGTVENKIVLGKR